MACITIPLKESFKIELSLFPWVNWSEVGREESLKKEIIDQYIKTGNVSNKDKKFCEQIDWHPVDELPLKKEFIKQLNKTRKKSPSKAMTSKEFNKWCDKL